MNAKLGLTGEANNVRTNTTITASVLDVGKFWITAINRFFVTIQAPPGQVKI